MVRTPWTPEYHVEFFAWMDEEQSINHYACHTLDYWAPCLFFGSDEESPGKTMNITLSSNSAIEGGSGTMDVWFPLSADYDKAFIGNLTISQTHLSFSIWGVWIYNEGLHGPIMMDLNFVEPQLNYSMCPQYCMEAGDPSIGGYCNFTTQICNKNPRLIY